MIGKLLTAMLLFCTIAFAQPPQGPPPGGPDGGPFGGGHREFGPGPEMHTLLPPGRWWKNSDVAKAIGLNDNQVQKIEQIFQDSRMKLVDIHANLQKEEIKLEPLLEADNPDEGAVLSAIDRIAAARATLVKANAQMAFAIRRVLTPDQWKKLREFRRQRDRFPPPAEGPRFRHRRDEQGPPPAPPTSPEPGANPGNGDNNK